jgi:hypothetical protein
LTFNEGYGGKPEFLRELDGRKQRFVGEVPTTFTGWIHAPRVTERPFRRAKGRGRKMPRTLSGSRPAISVENLLHYSPELRDQRRHTGVCRYRHQPLGRQPCDERRHPDFANVHGHSV